MTTVGPAPLLAVEHVTKRYGGVIALDDVSLTVARGEVRAILGKNGAGKSTLVNLLSGAIRPDAGWVELDGNPVEFRSPADSLRAGIATVHQELSIVPGLTVAENIMLGKWGKGGLVNESEMKRVATTTLRRLKSRLDPNLPAANLTIAEWQTIEIARALTRDVRVLILDEPTSALAPHDANALIAIVRALAGEGVTILYVTHRLDEVPRVADRISVFRDGSVVVTVDAASCSASELVGYMVGSASEELAGEMARRRAATHGDVVLDVRGLEVRDRLHGIGFQLRAGEVLGLAGLVGAGATEVLRAIFGLVLADRGLVAIAGQRVDYRTPARMRRLGVAMAPDDRKREGLFPDLSVSDNIALGSFDQVSRFGVINFSMLATVTDRAIASLGIRTSGHTQLVRYLSGGNQQKVVFARCLGNGIRVLLLDEPTRGVDVEAKAQIYELLRRLASEGMAIIVAPSEFDEFAYLCDRVLVLRHGQIVGELKDRNVTTDNVLSLAFSDAPDQLTKLPHNGQVSSV